LLTKINNKFIFFIIVDVDFYKNGFTPSYMGSPGFLIK